MRLQPLGSNVLVRRSKPDAISKGGIILPDNAQKPIDVGDVIAVGPGTWERDGRRPVSVKPGDRVYWMRHMGQPVEVDGEELLLLPEDVLVGVAES